MFLVAWVAVLLLVVSVIGGVVAGVKLGQHTNVMVSPVCVSQGGTVPGC